MDDEGKIWATTFTDKGRKRAVESLLESLPPDSSFKEERTAYADKILGKMKSLVKGKEVSFGYELAMDSVPSFYRRVYGVLRKVPQGRVISYGDLAKATGVGRAARAVGNAMKNNPFPLVVPCHRVIKSDRSLGGFGEGVDLKEKILLKEGISFKKGRVDKNSLLHPGEVAR